MKSWQAAASCEVQHLLIFVHLVSPLQLTLSVAGSSQGRCPSWWLGTLSVNNVAFKAHLLGFGKCILLLICFLTVGKGSKNEEFCSSFGFLKSNSQFSDEITGVV